MNSWEAEARRLVRERLAAEPGRVAALWAEVETEAWQEVRAVLKAALVEALLAELGAGRQRIEADKRMEERGQRIETDKRMEVRASAYPLSSVASGTYVYGIVDRADLSGLPAHGVAEGQRVTLLPYRDLAAVVSAVPLDEWSEEPLKVKLADMAWLEAKVRGHQAVLDALLPQATLVPMKFATIYYSLAGVEKLLAEHYDEFVTLLSHLRGRHEWGLKLYCNEAQLATHIAEVSPEVQRLQAEIASKPKGAAYLLARKLQEISQQEVERVSLDVADDIHTALAAVSAANRMNPIQSAEITGRSERMLLNAAYLVDDTALAAFRAILEQQAADPNNRSFEFQLTGPWPPYNFVTLHGAVEGEADG